MWKDSYKCAALETQYMPISCACYLYEMYDFGISLHSLAHNEKFLFISSIHRPFWITAYRSIIIDASFFSVSPPPPVTCHSHSFTLHSLTLFLSVSLTPALSLYPHQAGRLQSTSPLSFYLYVHLILLCPHQTRQLQSIGENATWWLRIFFCISHLPANV